MRALSLAGTWAVFSDFLGVEFGLSGFVGRVESRRMEERSSRKFLSRIVRAFYIKEVEVPEC
jgi:hypothetical protein